jgi:hypothetical protein
MTTTDRGTVTLTGSGASQTAACGVNETTVGAITYNALFSGDVNFIAGGNPTPASWPITPPSA